MILREMITVEDDVQDRSGTSAGGVRCQIIRDDGIVADESSDSGTVTCSVGNAQ